MHKYLVECWINPPSGFELARKNRIIALFRELMSSRYPDDKAIERAVARFEKETDGFILEPLFIESDKMVADYETELMPEVRKKYPRARLYNCELISELT